MRLGITDYAKDTILGVLQEFFSNEKNVGPDFLYNRNIPESKTLIADKYTINLEDIEKRPAIIVMRGAQSWGRRGLDQFLGWEGKNTGSRHTDLVQSTFNCTCMSRQGLEAETLAHFVFGFFSFFKKPLREGLIKGLHDIQGVILGEELVAKTDSDNDVSVVPVTISMLFQWKWLVEQRGPEFRDVTVCPSVGQADKVTKLLQCAKPPLVAV
jgi:hypothetical protein